MLKQKFVKCVFNIMEIYLQLLLLLLSLVKGKGKAFLLQAWISPEGSRRLR
jgi:hypothetical protein